MNIIDNVHIGAGVLDKLDELVVGRDLIYITDTNVARIYSNFFANHPTIVMGVGEVNKNLATVDHIHSQLIAFGADRHTFIVGIGGGIVTDVVGFVASTYMRGVDFGFIATTLVAQIDASVGGKNGVNVGGYKNMAGVFNKPSFVLCDINFLATLPQVELDAAWGEIIKCALIAEPSLLQATNWDDIVSRCVAIKADIVADDFTEKGRRKLLNLGHTLGHSLEKITGGVRYLHGQAVAIGIVAAARISVKKGLLSAIDCKFIERVILEKGLPIEFPTDIDKLELVANAMADKKHNGDGVDMILLNSIGSPVVVNVDADELRQLL